MAAVSLVPRFRFKWEVEGEEHQPMGSYCLIIRRDIIIKENLSFRTVHQKSINPKSYKGEYDTADFANVELLRRGYDIQIAPQKIREHLIVNKGISSSILKFFQNNHKDFNPESTLTEVTFFSLLFITRLKEWINEYFPQYTEHLYQYEVTKVTLEELKNIFPSERIQYINHEISSQFSKINDHFEDTRV